MSMKKSWVSWLLITLATLSVIFLRLYKLGTVPNGIHADEASYGYDAYSILKTGRDVWGERLPLAFKSFGEYKLNLTYLIAPAIQLVGLNTTATRAPSAIAGIATAFVLYSTLNLLYKNKIVNAILTLIFTTSPWTFGISRVFFESNVALAFFAFGFFGILRAIKTQKADRLHVLSLISLALAGYFYAPLRFIGGAALVAGLYYSRQAVHKSLFIYLLIIIPILPQYFSGIGLKRLEQESGLRSFEHALIIDENRAFCGYKFCYGFWNKPVMRLESIVHAAAASIGVNYLFLDSVDGYIVPPSTGPYLSYLLPFFFVGIYVLTKKKEPLLVCTLLISLLIASSGGKLSLYRNVVGLYLVFVIIALGTHASYEYVRKHTSHIRNVLLIMFFIVAGYLHARFLTHYFLVYAKSATFAWSSDAEHIARYIGERADDYRTIMDKSAGDFGPLYYAFFNGYDPELFRVRAEWTSGDPAGWTHVGKLGHIVSFDNRSIENLLCEKASAPQDEYSALYITAPLGDYSRFADRVTTNWRGDKILHEFYDIDSLYDKLQSDNVANIPRICPREAALWPKR